MPEYNFGYRVYQLHNRGSEYTHLYVEVARAPKRLHEDWKRIFSVRWQSDRDSIDRDAPWYGCQIYDVNAASPQELYDIGRTCKNMLGNTDQYHFHFGTPPEVILSVLDERRNVTRIIYDPRCLLDVPVHEVKPSEYSYYTDPGGYHMAWGLDEYQAQQAITKAWAGAVADGTDYSNRFAKWVNEDKPVEYRNKRQPAIDVFIPTVEKLLVPFGYNGGHKL